MQFVSGKCSKVWMIWEYDHPPEVSQNSMRGLQCSGLERCGLGVGTIWLKKLIKAIGTASFKGRTNPWAWKQVAFSSTSQKQTPPANSYFNFSALWSYFPSYFPSCHSPPPKRGINCALPSGQRQTNMVLVDVSPIVCQLFSFSLLSS